MSSAFWHDPADGAPGPNGKEAAIPKPSKTKAAVVAAATATANAKRGAAEVRDAAWTSSMVAAATRPKSTQVVGKRGNTNAELRKSAHGYAQEILPRLNALRQVWCHGAEGADIRGRRWPAEVQEDMIWNGQRFVL
jgi:hypothetical protein